MLHGLLLPGLLDLGLCLLHFLPQVGELGRWFSWRLTLPVGHVGGPPTQFYRWRARIGRIGPVIDSEYSLLDQFHGKGHATEALCGFREWVRPHPHLRRVVADTFPHLTASIRVLEKNGFVHSGAGTDEGSIRFELVVR